MNLCVQAGDAIAMTLQEISTGVPVSIVQQYLHGTRRRSAQRGL